MVLTKWCLCDPSRLILFSSPGVYYVSAVTFHLISTSALPLGTNVLLRNQRAAILLCGSFLTLTAGCGLLGVSL